MESYDALPNPPPLTSEQRVLVASTVPILEQHGSAIPALMYKKMFDTEPTLREVFSHTRQIRGLQTKALAGAVLAYAQHIDDLTPIVPVVEHIAQKHASLHILPSQYSIVATSLLSAIRELVGADTFSGALYDAWYAAYWNLAHIFIKRERELYDAAGWEGWREFVLARKTQETEDVTSFYFKPRDGAPLPAYRAGQYISIQVFVPVLGFKQNRQYSLSSEHHLDRYRISVRREPGVASDHPGMISNLLHETLEEGDTVELAHPFGAFCLDTSTAPVVLLSAGVGATPLFAMLQTLVSASTRKVSWIHGTRNGRSHVFKTCVDDLARAHTENLKTFTFYSRPADSVDVLGSDYHSSGRMDLSKLDPEMLFLENSNSQYYVCGPEGFMADMFKALMAFGVAGDRVHVEAFGEAQLPKQ